VSAGLFCFITSLLMLTAVLLTAAKTSDGTNTEQPGPWLPLLLLLLLPVVVVVLVVVALAVLVLVALLLLVPVAAMV
jgi:hypothetical protein